MKATGIIRRIDDLGRVVIPKEIRKNLRIKEGDNLEIFVSGEEVILKKYSMMNKINDLAFELTDSIYTFMKHSIFITDTDTVIVIDTEKDCASLLQQQQPQQITNQTNYSFSKKPNLSSALYTPSL